MYIHTARLTALCSAKLRKRSKRLNRDEADNCWRMEHTSDTSPSLQHYGCVCVCVCVCVEGVEYSTLYGIQQFFSFFYQRTLFNTTSISPRSPMLWEEGYANSNEKWGLLVTLSQL